VHHLFQPHRSPKKWQASTGNTSPM